MKDFVGMESQFSPQIYGHYAARKCWRGDSIKRTALKLTRSQIDEDGRSIVQYLGVPASKSIDDVNR